LNLKEGLGTGVTAPYRLPTEAEWEYACRAGTSTPFFFGDLLSPDQANYHSNYPSPGVTAIKSRGETSLVGSFAANTWGLHDLHGNVFEWCADWYASYPDTDVEDPRTQTGGTVRVVRGGSWHSLMRRCRSACRGWGAPTYRGSDVGFRACFRLESDYIL
jgi:formylglycine-generating enzyme required for sulfatase activity